MTSTLDLTADIIDIRDIIVRVEELRETIQGEGCEEQCREYQTELDTLGAVLDELKGRGGDEQWQGDWYPLSLIADSYFEQAMDDLLEDCGDLPKDLPCYLKITVDYDALKTDYTSIEIDGVTYWYR